MKSKLYFVLAVILVNLGLFVLGIYDIFDGWPLYQIPLAQILWLWVAAEKLNLPVTDESKTAEFMAAPNIFGWLLIILGSLITVFIYVYIAQLLSKRRHVQSNYDNTT